MNDIQRKRYEFHKRTAPFKLKCSRARVRAGNIKAPFNLTPEYLESIWTGVCPISGVKLELFGPRTLEDAAELDRFVPNLGYTMGNVTFISRKYNRLKNSASVGELERLIRWMKERQCE